MTTFDKKKITKIGTNPETNRSFFLLYELTTF